MESAMDIDQLDALLYLAFKPIPSIKPTADLSNVLD
jgi:hypothetical protein